MKTLNYILSIFLIEIVKNIDVWYIDINAEGNTAKGLKYEFMWYSLDGFKVPFTKQWSIPLTKDKLTKD